MKNSIYILVILICCTYLDTLAQGGAKWSVAGNGIDPGDYIGTTNNEDLILKANGTEGLRIKSNGKIDLSTNQVRINPQTTAATNIKFHNSNSQNGGFLIGINSGNNNSNSAIFNLKENRNMIFKTNAVEQMRIDNLGNVGIGTNALSSRLTVAGTIETTSGGVKFPDGTVQTSAYSVGTQLGTQANPYSELYSTNHLKVGNNSLFITGTATWNGGSGNEIFTDNGPLYINPTGANADGVVSDGYSTIINQHDGHVGIGEEAPKSKLDLTLNPDYLTEMESGIRINYQTILPPLGTQVINESIFEIKNTSLASGDQKNFVVNRNGKVGVGKTNPLHQLHVDGNVLIDGTSNNLFFGATSTGNNGEWSIAYDETNSGLEIFKPASAGLIANALFLKDDGNIGIGTAEPRHSLHTTGNILIEGDYKSLLFGEDPPAAGTGPNKGQFGIEYEPTARGLNFWKPWGSSNSAQTANGFKNFILFLSDDGNVGVGTDEPLAKLHVDGKVFVGDIDLDAGCTDCVDYQMYVRGGIRTEKVKVDIADVASWADYVFEEDYELKSLGEVEDYIAKNGHLPDVPSADEVVEKGINIAEMDALLLQKIEELTLHLIQLEKENNALKLDMTKLKQ